MSSKVAPRIAAAIARPTATAPVLRNVRGHAAAVDPPAPGPGVSRQYFRDGDIRHDWRRSEIQKIFDGPLMETIFRAVSPGSFPPSMGDKADTDRLPYIGCITMLLEFSCVRS